MDSVKQEIKEEIPDESFDDENGLYDNHSAMQNVKHEVEFEDELDQYYSMAVSQQPEFVEDDQDSEFETELNALPTIDTHSTSNSEEDDNDEEQQQQHHHHQPVHMEDYVYVEDEPEVFYEDISDNFCKENASDPLAMNTTAAYANDTARATITHPPNAPAAATLIRLPVGQKRPPPKMPEQNQKLLVIRKVPPVNQLVNKTYSSAHRLPPKPKTWHTCDVCARSFSNPNELRQHRSRCFFKCKKCNLICNTSAQLKTHIKQCTTAPSKTKKQIQKQRSAEALRARAKLDQSQTLPNIYCSEFDSDEELYTHRKQSNIVANAYACHLCERKFDTNLDARDHLERDH